MTIIHLYQLGVGKVGKAFIETANSYCSNHKNIEIFWEGIENSKGLVGELRLQDESRRSQEKKRIFLDLTASNNTTPRLIDAKKKGWGLILANKNPLVQSQKIFDELMNGPIGFRATVGAGLPVIPEIMLIKQEGHKILRMEACLSGTLGILCSELEKGHKFSEIIRDAVKQGFTEPDPRMDLEGGDVAKKLLILTRFAGNTMELSDIHTETLFPPPFRALEIEDFLTQLSFLDPIIEKRVNQAKEIGQCLRYVASFDKGKCNVGLKSVDKDSPLGRLKDDDKRIIIQTNKSDSEPIIITGAGSGPKSTAKDLLKDLLNRM